MSDEALLQVHLEFEQASFEAQRSESGVKRPRILIEKEDDPRFKIGKPLKTEYVLNDGKVIGYKPDELDGVTVKFTCILRLRMEDLCSGVLQLNAFLTEGKVVKSVMT